MRVEDHLIPVWGGSMTPMNYCISLLKVDVEQERNDRYSQFQNWAFEEPPMLKPMDEIPSLWKHSDKAKLCDNWLDSIKAMVKLFEEENPYDEWKKARIAAMYESLSSNF